MKYYQMRSITATLAAVLFFLYTANSQDAKNHKEDFAAAVDQVNCAAVKFIHRENGRNDVADKMECFTFESILHSIPDDEATTTAKFCKNINALKDKFKEGDDAGKKADELITYVVSRIAGKKRKGSVDDFKNKLGLIKDEMLKNIAETDNTSTKKNTDKPTVEEPKKDEPATTTTSSDNTTKDTVKTTTAVIKPVTETASKEIQPEESKTDTKDMLLWAALGIAILGLILSLFTMLRLRSHVENTTGNNEKTAENSNRPVAQSVNESAANYKVLETRMADDMRKLRGYIDEQISQLTNKTGSGESSSFSPEEKSAPAQTTHTAASLEKSISTKNTDTPSSLFSDYKPSTVEETPPPAPPSAAADEDEDSTPIYRYIGAPDADNYFNGNSFADEASPDSLFQIEMYDDVPNRAFYSPLTFPHVAARFLDQPEKNLYPFCTFSEDMDGKKKLVLVEEGVIEKKDADLWQVVTKAKVKLE